MVNETHQFFGFSYWSLFFYFIFIFLKNYYHEA